ncbi:hypothetical protein [Bacteroides sp.]|uniref:hypothetical protein n=1 Tax=Bacteroides sp. TaxID=29523 RepID=UPI0013284EA2|nr:hypothetical protein [Escherichia coli]
MRWEGKLSRMPPERRASEAGFIFFPESGSVAAFHDPGTALRLEQQEKKSKPYRKG